MKTVILLLLAVRNHAEAIAIPTKTVSNQHSTASVATEEIATNKENSIDAVYETMSTLGGWQNMEMALWQAYLITVPSLIAVLGSLVIISGGHNFDLYANNLASGPKYNDSLDFRIRTQNIADEMYFAFQNVQTNMAQISDEARSLKNLNVKLGKMLASDSAKKIAKWVPIYLTRMRKKSNTTSMLAVQSERKFMQIMHSLQRIGEDLIGTETYASSDMANMKEALILMQMRQDQKDKVLSHQLEILKQTDIKMITAHRKYYDAIDNMAHENAFLILLQNIFSYRKRSYDDNKPSDTVLDQIRQNSDGSSEGIKKATNQYLENKRMLKVARGYNMVLGRIIAILNTTIYDKHSPLNDRYATVVKQASELLENECEMLSNYTFNANVFYGNCNTSLNIIKIYQKAGIRNWNNADKTLTVMSNLEDLIKSSERALESEQELLGSIAPRHLTPDEENGPQGYELKLKFAKKMYNYRRTRHNKKYHELLTLKKELDKLALEILKVDLTEADAGPIQSLIAKAVTTMTKLKSFWSEMIEMLQKFGSIINHVLVPAVEAFKKNIDLKTTFANEQTDSKRIRDIYFHDIDKELSRLSTSAMFVKLSAEMYLEVSEECFMTPLSRMMPLSFLNTDAEQESHIALLYEAINRTETKITEFIDKKNIEYRKDFDNSKMMISQIYKTFYHQNTSELMN